MIDATEIQLPGVDRLTLRQPMPKAKFDPLSREIFTLKKQLNAVILAHNYQVPEIQHLAGCVGDARGLSRHPPQTRGAVILLCRVRLMAEPANIVNPDEIVALRRKAGACWLEHSCTLEQL